MASHLREGAAWGTYEATTGETVTLFAEHLDYHPRGLPSDRWIQGLYDSDQLIEVAGEPEIGGRLHFLRATYGGKQPIPAGQAVTELTFTVESGKKTLSLLFSVGGGPYEEGRLEEDCGDGTAQTLGQMTAEYPVKSIVIQGRARRLAAAIPPRSLRKN